MKVTISKFGMLIGLITILEEFDDEGSGTSWKALKPLLWKLCEHNNYLRLNVTISKCGMLIGLVKIFDEFDDEDSGTPLRALKTLTLNNLVNTIDF